MRTEIARVGLKVVRSRRRTPDETDPSLRLFGWTGGWEPKPLWDGTFGAKVFMTPKT